MSHWVVVNLRKAAGGGGACMENNLRVINSRQMVGGDGMVDVFLILRHTTFGGSITNFGIFYFHQMTGGGGITFFANYIGLDVGFHTTGGGGNLRCLLLRHRVVSNRWRLYLLYYYNVLHHH